MAEWFYNSDSGAIDSQSGVVQWFNDHTGVNDLNTKFLAWHGPFGTKEEAFKYYTDNKAAHPDWKEPTDSAFKQFSNVVGASDAIGLNGNINAGNWIIRVSEILLGIVLIGVGLAKLTGTTNVVSRFAKVV
jgi:hypothetical protein